jgi:thiol:disulfide interchange protein DsbD
MNFGRGHKSEWLTSAVAVVVFLIFISFNPSRAEEKSHVQAELLTEVKTIQPGSSFWVALRLTMDERWHIYWRNPGDTGLETLVEWQLPLGFTAGEALYPFPERISEPPLVVYGYHGEQFLLCEIRAASGLQAGSMVTLRATVSWLVCADVCVPGDQEASVELPVTDGTPAIDEKRIDLFATARSRLPLISPEWKWSAVAGEKSFTLQAEPPAWFKDEISGAMFMPYAADIIAYSGAQTWTKKGNLYQLEIARSTNADSVPAQLRGIVVSETGWRGRGTERALEINVPLGTRLTGSVGSDGLSNIGLALLFSFLGGLILNLMPCVLPVLSIKIMGFISQAHDEQTAAWKHGLVFTLGVLASFWALAGALLILKAGGSQLGWGFQLQSPLFLIFLAVFMFLFGLSMFGVFEIGTSLTTVGGATRKMSGWTASFISGVTATIVATPCTAPFMGSALGYALTQPAWVSMLVFTFLGLGMAAPFVLLSSVPALMKFVPRPGRWMESLKQFMGFLLVATVIWLLWVLGLQAGANALVLVLLNLLVVAVGGWIYGRWGHLAMPGKTRLVSTLVAAILIIGSTVYTIANIDNYSVKQQHSGADAEGVRWQPFSDEAVQQALAQGKPVFIDFTAAWCLSCQVNEQVAFSPKEVQDKFAELGISAFKADWTNRDEKIARALAGFGRNSVPLYVLYNGKPDEPPQILPEILTPGIIMEALQSIQ